MSNTTNLGLKKYASSEKFAITAQTNSFNNNMDLIDKAIGNEAPLYDATDAYYVGDYCMYNGVTYRCISDIETPEAFDNTHWEAVTITEELADTNLKKEQLDSGLAYVAEKVGSYWRLPSGKTAVAGDYIILDGSLGKATSQIVGGSTNITNSNWSISTNGALNELGDSIDTVLANEAEQYDATDAYYVGDYCIYNGVTYRCTVDIETPEAFNSSHWAVVKITDEIANANLKKEQLDEGLAYVAKKDGNNWRLPSGKTAEAGDYIILDGLLGKATSQIVGGSTNITSSNWSISTNGALNELGDSIDTLNGNLAKSVVNITNQCSSETLAVLSAKYVKSGKNVILSLNLSGGVNGISRGRHTVVVPLNFQIGEPVSFSTIGNLNTEGTSYMSALAVPCFIQYTTLYLDIAYAYGCPNSFINDDINGNIKFITVVITGILNS